MNYAWQEGFLEGRRGSGIPGPKPVRRDWVSCPICGEPEMQREWYSEIDGPYIKCTNTVCASNGGFHGKLSPPVGNGGDMIPDQA